MKMRSVHFRNRRTACLDYKRKTIVIGRIHEKELRKYTNLMTALSRAVFFLIRSSLTFIEYM